MSPSRSTGTSESSWHVARRCLAILRRIQQGPARKKELLTAVFQSEGPDAYGDATGRALNKRFEGDCRRIRDRLYINIRYRRQAGGYVIAGEERPLLDLPDDDIETLAFLADTFQPDTPHGQRVQTLVDRLLSWLAADRRHLYRRARGLLPDVELRQRDNDEIAADVWETVLEAHHKKQQLKFDYLSSTQADGVPRQHVVEPWYVYFTRRGHYRLRAYCLFNDGPHGPWHPNTYINYRLGRIISGSAKLLPTKLPPTPRTPRPYDAIYELAPEIARLGVSRQPELVGEPRVMEMDEGWVRIEGRTHDVFQLARSLLHYGPNCHVLGGRELVAEVRQLVQGLCEFYL